MKGTLISTDFVKDSSGNYKFLEINTDAGTSKEFIDNYLDLSDLHTLINEHTTTIDTFEVVYKPLLHSDFVEALSQSISDNISSITTFTKHAEDIDTIYPTSPDDDENKFILRLAYDENAILDSTYAKKTIEPLILFSENTSSNAVPCYYSASLDGESEFIDNLNRETNSSNYPDLVMKSIGTDASVQFLKLKNGSTDTEKVNLFLSESTDRIVTNFSIHSDSTTDGIVQSVKHYSIVYGGNLSTINIGTYNLQSPLTLPTQSLTWIDTEFTNADALHGKHYYEFSTAIKKEKNLNGDLYETERIISSSGDPISIENIITGSTVQSYHIVGLPDSSDINDYMQWSQSGYTFLSGSEPTSSVIESFTTFSLDNEELIQIKVTGDDEYRYMPNSAKLLVYETGSNTTSFKEATQVKSDTDYFISATGTLIPIEESNKIFLNQVTGSTYNVDVEPADILVTDGSTIGGLGFIMHNITCFAAGTRISLSNGDEKNIEDVVVGDEVLGWNGKSLESSTVIAIDHRHTVGGHGDACKSLGDEPSLYTINDTGIEFTPEHPFLTKDGWKSLVPNPNDEPYKSIQEPKVLSVGDFILRNDKWEEINTIGIVRSDSEERVYNITVEKLHSYVANGIVVHNKGGYT